MSAEIVWPDGSISEIQQITPNALYEVNQSSAEFRTHQAPKRIKPLFRDASERIRVWHVENMHDDFISDPLKPSSQSELGPGVCAVDVDGDGFDEFFIGGAKGGRLLGFKFSQALQSGTPTDLNLPWGGNLKLIRDNAAILGYESPSSGLVLLSALSSHEDGLAVGSALNALSWDSSREILAAGPDSAGPMSMADIDGDGDLDLFVGGRTRKNDPYLAISSTVYLNTSDGFTPMKESGVNPSEVLR